MHPANGIFTRYKYELLLFALVQHLFIGIFLKDLLFYSAVIWPINIVILGIASVGVFIEKGQGKNMLRIFLFLIVLALPLCLPFLAGNGFFMPLLSSVYALFFLVIFWEILRFLIKPSYINGDIISAAACGFFLLIEINTFILQALVYGNPNSIKGVSFANPAATFIDLVYFSSITSTSIGYGDILPNAHYTKLIASFFGIAGQFYSVVLVGILISKFTSKNNA